MVVAIDTDAAVMPGTGRFASKAHTDASWGCCTIRCECPARYRRWTRRGRVGIPEGE